MNYCKIQEWHYLNRVTINGEPICCMVKASQKELEDCEFCSHFKLEASWMTLGQSLSHSPRKVGNPAKKTAGTSQEVAWSQYWLEWMWLCTYTHRQIHTHKIFKKYNFYIHNVFAWIVFLIALNALTLERGYGMHKQKYRL